MIVCSSKVRPALLSPIPLVFIKAPYLENLVEIKGSALITTVMPPSYARSENNGEVRFKGAS